MDVNCFRVEKSQTLVVGKGGVRVPVIRPIQIYMRNESDLPCQSAACKMCYESGNAEQLPSPHLSATASHYVVIEASAIAGWIDLLEQPEITNVIFPQTALREAKHKCSARWYSRARAIAQDVVKYNIVFADDCRISTHMTRATCPRNERLQRATCATARWWHDHLTQAGVGIEVVVVSEGEMCRELAKELGISSYSWGEYLSRFFPSSPSLHDLYESIVASRHESDEQKSAILTDDMTADEAILAVKEGWLVSGTLRVGKFNSKNAFVARSSTAGGGGGEEVEDLLVPETMRNRAIDGDIVAVKILPRDIWQGTQRRIALSEEGGGGGGGGGGEEREEVSFPMPTASVACVIQRNDRLIVATLPDDTLSGGGGGGGGGMTEFVLAVPMDRRIPKIRIKTRQAQHLRGRRFVVRIDSWPRNSQYPSGHYVRELGALGSLDTEMSALLIENDVSDAPFSGSAMEEVRQLGLAVGGEIADDLVVGDNGNDKDTTDSCSLRRVVSGGIVGGEDTDGESLNASVYHCLNSNNNNNNKKRSKVGQVPIREFRVSPAELSSRRDLRHNRHVFSVDPIGCTDVDDALSACDLGHGVWEVGVHIADVSALVKHGSQLDSEAKRRGTTVYLVDRRFPMLPPELSEDLCSLRENVDRLTMSVIWRVRPSEDFKILDTWSGPTVIRSCSQMTYEEADAILSGDDRALGEESTALARTLRPDLQRLQAMARVLLRKRMEAGALDLSSNEMQFALDTQNMPRNVVEKDHLEIHTTIAEFMIAANSAVATLLKQKLPTIGLLRHHRPPAPQRVKKLQKLVWSVCDVTIDGTSNASLAASLAAANEALSDDPPLQAMVRQMAVQTMEEAQYVCTGTLPATDSCYHYGLAVELYTHFTSPIRRYADLQVHRLLRIAVENNNNNNNESSSSTNSGTTSARIEEPPISPPPPQQQQLSRSRSEEVWTSAAMSDLCQHLNDRHRASKSAQRQSAKVFIALYVQLRRAEHPEEEMQEAAVVDSVRSNGLLVILPRLGLNLALVLKDNQGRVMQNQLSPSLLNGISEDNLDLELKGSDDNETLAVVDRSTRRTVVEFRKFDSLNVVLEADSSKARGPTLKIRLSPALPLFRSASQDETSGLSSNSRKKPKSTVVPKSEKEAVLAHASKSKKENSARVAISSASLLRFDAVVDAASLTGATHKGGGMYHIFRYVLDKSEIRPVLSFSTNDSSSSISTTTMIETQEEKENPISGGGGGGGNAKSNVVRRWSKIGLSKVAV